MKSVLYTCIIGDYDMLLDPAYITPGWDYICFTDNYNVKSKVWKIVHIDSKYDNTRQAREVKVKSQFYLPNYDISIWADGSVIPNCNLDLFVNTYLNDGSDLAVSMHPDRNCVYQEISKCVELNKDDIPTMLEYRNLLKKQGYPAFNGLVQTGIIIRKHSSEQLKIFSELWWKEILQYSARDQLSFNYIMHNNPITYNMFSADVFNNEFILYRHSKSSDVAIPAVVRSTYGNNFYEVNRSNDTTSSNTIYESHAQSEYTNFIDSYILQLNNFKTNNDILCFINSNDIKELLNGYTHITTKKMDFYISSKNAEAYSEENVLFDTPNIKCIRRVDNHSIETAIYSKFKNIDISAKYSILERMNIIEDDYALISHLELTHKFQYKAYMYVTDLTKADYSINVNMLNSNTLYCYKNSCWYGTANVMDMFFKLFSNNSYVPKHSYRKNILKCMKEHNIDVRFY